jgi:hypothetical protein
MLLSVACFILVSMPKGLKWSVKTLKRNREKTLTKTENGAEGTALLNAGGICYGKD